MIGGSIPNWPTMKIKHLQSQIAGVFFFARFAPGLGKMEHID
jgi:hypothetical protein